jgi:hypothetical protein
MGARFLFFLLEADRDPPDSDRDEVSLDAEAYVTAALLAQQRGTSIPQLLRTAVTTQRWFDDVRAAGNRMLVERGGKLSELVEIREKTRSTDQGTRCTYDPSGGGEGSIERSIFPSQRTKSAPAKPRYSS